MAVPMIQDKPERPTLQIRYDTEVPIGSVEFGRLVQELGKGFDRYARNRRLRNLRLVVVGAGLGSHWLDVAVIGAGSAVGAVIKYRKEIYEFADFLGKLFAMARSLRREGVKAADKKLIDAINAPVANGQATQVNVTVLGGSPVITINQNTSTILWPTDPADELGIESLTDSSAADRKIDQSSRTPAIRQLDRHFGTIFDVKGQWYVRLEGQEGVMNPVSLAAGVSVKDDQAYLLDGSWEGRRYAIRKAETVG